MMINLFYFAFLLLFVILFRLAIIILVENLQYLYHHFRNQTTKGIWIAKAVGIEPYTVVMDLEGTDGRERGEVISLSLNFPWV